MTGNQPWFSPYQIAAALGFMLPLFLYFFWRLYSMVMEHRVNLRAFLDRGETQALVMRYLSGVASSSAQFELAISRVWGEFDYKIDSLRRSIRADVYTLILLGFLGTLIGMTGAFTTLIHQASGKVNPQELINRLVSGGLATALISSIVAAVMGGIAMSYLSFTERKVAQARALLTEVCKDELTSFLSREVEH